MKMVSTVEIILMMIPILFTSVGLGALWKFLIDNVRKNEMMVQEIRDIHDDDIDDIEKRIDKRIEEIKDIVQCSSLLGQQERDTLARIDENVSNVESRIEKLEERMDNITRLRFRD